MSNDETKIKNKSLHKALRVLDCFIEKQPMGVTEISERLGLYKSNVYDILSTMSAMGYVKQDVETGKYSLGLSALCLGRAAKESFGFHKQAMAHMREIAQITGEVCYLTVPQGKKIYFLDAAAPSNNYLMQVYLNNSLESMHCTGSGKSMLAFMSSKDVESYLSEPLEPRTEKTITSPDKLREELISIRLKGYSIDDEEHSIGLKCVAAPIICNNGQPIGALSVSGPSPRFTPEKIREFAQILIQHTNELAKIL